MRLPLLESTSFRSLFCNRAGLFKSAALGVGLLAGTLAPTAIAGKSGTIEMYQVGLGRGVDPTFSGSTHELDVRGVMEGFFVQQNQECVGRISKGQVYRYQMPPGSDPHGIAVLNSLRWVLFEGTNSVGELTYTGRIRRTLPLTPDLSHIPGVTGAGPHGLTASGTRLWYAGKEGSVFGWINPKTRAQGSVAAPLVPSGESMVSAKPIWVAPDGAGGVWGTQLISSKLCRVSVSSSGVTSMQEWTLGDNGITDYPIGIVSDGRGGAWFSVEGEPDDATASGYFGHLRSDGKIFTWKTPRPFARLGGLAYDGRGTLWTEYTTSLQEAPVACIAQIKVSTLVEAAGTEATLTEDGYHLNILDPGAALTEIPIEAAAGANHFLHRIQVDRNGKKVWFTDIWGDQVGIYYVP